ncbi:MAG: class I SAM-dependent methyltransferase [Actinomycetota bacterium]|nr:class I SAM-dependent methyltransferase [Actinomycetota bacterium]
MMVHEAAASGFDRAAIAYERGRPSYPQPAIDWLVERAGVTATSVVVDLAAGTGKLTRLLVASGAKVIAVEPVDGMRRLLVDLVPGAEVLDGTAEDIPLLSGSVDLVTVAQAFHWFDVPAALAEIHRVLCPGGQLALVWNRRLLDEPIHRSVSAIVDPFRGSTPSYHKEEGWRQPLRGSPLFETGDNRSFLNVQALDEDGFADRVLSTSFIAALPERKRHDVERRVRDLAQQLGGHVDLPYSTDVQLFRRVESDMAG